MSVFQSPTLLVVQHGSLGIFQDAKNLAWNVASTPLSVLPEPAHPLVHPGCWVGATVGGMQVIGGGNNRNEYERALAVGKALAAGICIPAHCGLLYSSLPVPVAGNACSPTEAPAQRRGRWMSRLAPVEELPCLGELPLLLQELTLDAPVAKVRCPPLKHCLSSQSVVLHCQALHELCAQCGDSTWKTARFKGLCKQCVWLQYPEKAFVEAHSPRSSSEVLAHHVLSARLDRQERRRWPRGPSRYALCDCYPSPSPVLMFAFPLPHFGSVCGCFASQVPFDLCAKCGDTTGKKARYKGLCKICAWVQYPEEPKAEVPLSISVPTLACSFERCFPDFRPKRRRSPVRGLSTAHGPE